MNNNNNNSGRFFGYY